MPYLKAKDGTEIYYYDWGTGAPVVLIHGWPLSSASWEYQARVLAENGYRVIAYDRRGFGRSGWAWTGHDYNTLAGDLDSVIDTLDLRGATLVGFSMGGGEVVRYLSRFGSSRVSKAVLISAVTPYLLKSDDNPEGVGKKTFDAMMDGLVKDRPAFLAKFAHMFYGRTLVKHAVSDEILDFTFNLAMQASPKATLDQVRSFSETDFRADCLGITVPTLVIHGTNDSTVPLEVSGKRAAAMIPNAELLEYDGEPHGLYATVPDKLNADLLEFLRR